MALLWVTCNNLLPRQEEVTLHKGLIPKKKLDITKEEAKMGVDSVCHRAILPPSANASWNSETVWCELSGHIWSCHLKPFTYSKVTQPSTQCSFLLYVSILPWGTQGPKRVVFPVTYKEMAGLRYRSCHSAFKPTCIFTKVICHFDKIRPFFTLKEPIV